MCPFAALQLRRPRLVLFISAIIMADFVYRAIFVHALVKAIRQRTVENCVWESPTRTATIGGILLAIGSALMACTRAGAKRRQGYVGK